MTTRVSDILVITATAILAFAKVNAAESAASEELWIDVDGCRFLNPGGDPPPGLKVRRTAQCDGGMVSGEGEVTLEVPGQPVPIKYVGHFANGRIERGRWESQFVYEGEFKDNQADGEGEMMYPDGKRISGRFTNSRVAAEGTYKVSFVNGARYVGELDRRARMHGNGVLSYADGSTYEGEFREDRLEGRGTLKRANGQTASGQFVAGYLSGQGVMTWANGTIYEGAFVVGSPQGQGTMRFADGSQYTGGFISGKYSGKGRLEYAEGGQCEADFVDGQLHGQGKCLYANGDRYEGGFLADQMTGDGTMTTADGTFREGRFLNGKITGRCRIEYPTGYRFEGQCNQDLAEGHGHMEDPRSNIVYDGGFRQNMSHGEGTLTRGPSTYKGTFKDGKRAGRGVETIREDESQIVYEGEFLNDVWHGQGKLRMQIKDGAPITYEGQYAHGRMEGQGVLHSFGRTVRGEFKADVFVKGTIETEGGRTFEVDMSASSIKEVMKDGTKRDLDALPEELSVGA